MAARKKRSKRDIEKDYPRTQFIAKLRRLADCLENDERFRIQVAGERVSVPPGAIIGIGHERGSFFFSVEVLTQTGLIRYFVLFIIDLRSRRIEIAGIAVDRELASAPKS